MPAKAKAQAAQPTNEQPEENDGASDSGAEAPSDVAEPDPAVEAEQIGRLNEWRGQRDAIAVKAALAALPDTLRVVVVLRELEGWSHRDIARFLGLREGAVMTRHSRAMARLRTALEGER